MKLFKVTLTGSRDCDDYNGAIIAAEDAEQIEELLASPVWMEKQDSDFCVYTHQQMTITELKVEDYKRPTIVFAG